MQVKVWGLVFVGCLVLPLTAVAAGNESLKEIAAFNQKLLVFHQQMDHAGILAMWAEDGVDLMPGEAPIKGKKAITEWLNGVLAQFPNHKVTKQELEWHDIQVAGDWASEWADSHQVVQPPGDKPAIETYGKMALILHRENGDWKIKQEMWNSSLKP